MYKITSYTPIRIGRSDGSTEIKSDKHGREPNGPSTDQLDRVVNPDDYYELLSPDHPIALEWKRSLGAMLQKERAPGARSSDQKWLLLFFPENYRLYKHVNTKKASSTKSSKSKGGDGDAHGDAYLYGYPLGRKKRYKTAFEFFPHLMWLAEDKSEDYGDCTCKHCAPDWVQKVEPLPGREGFVPAGVSAGAAIKKETAPAKKEVKKESAPPVKKEPAQPKRETNAPQQQPKVVIKNRPVSQDRVTKPPPKVAPSTAPTARPPPQPQQPAPTPLPTPTNPEQATDSLYARFTYRPGEVTWFNRGAAWGLSVIITRTLFTDKEGRPNRPRYLVQPLSFPLRHPEMKWLDSEQDLRPWLAWSAPAATHAALSQPGSSYTFNNIDWKAVAEGKYGPNGDAEVDGSIFAAKMIDDSFTLVEMLTNNTMTTGERSYNAIYLGGEKVWIGEPVRLRVHGGQDMMVVSHIIEKLKPGSTNTALASVLMVGDVYRWTMMPATPGTMTEPQGFLPVRVREDLEYRNRVTRAKKGMVGHWKLLQIQHRLSIAEVKGRWYESSILLPILRGVDSFAQDMARGEISDVGHWINGREDANGMTGGRVGTRMKNRLEAFGRSVPEGMKMGQVPDTMLRPSGGPPVFPLAPASSSSAVLPVQVGGNRGGVAMSVDGDGGQVTGVSDGDIAEFMDLDKMDDDVAREFVEGGRGKP